MNQINQTRGGDEGINCFLFSDIAKWSNSQIGYFTSKKLHEINHLSSKPMKKLIWRIKFVNQPRKAEDTGIGNQIP